jgi:hypothetical protein
MIGPHQGKELELMLAGEKAFAFFHDVVPASGHISEEIIPEKAFAPYVQKGTIKRFSEEFKSNEHIVRYVCFTLPGQEWRAQFFLWYKDELMSGCMVFDPSHEYIIGNLLGYHKADIEEYIKRLSLFRKDRRAIA